MKVELNEYGSAFGIDLTPETVEDVVKIARLKMNGIKEVRNIGASFHQDGAAYGYITIGKRRQPESSL